MESAYAMYRARMGGVRLPPMDVDYSAEIKQYPTWVVVSEESIIGGLIMVFENNYASIANIAVNLKLQGLRLSASDGVYSPGPVSRRWS